MGNVGATRQRCRESCDPRPAWSRPLNLYPLVLKGVEKGVIISWQLRLWQMVAGIAAACGSQWNTAQEHFETALRQAHELPHKVAQPEVRRWYAQMLLDPRRSGPTEPRQERSSARRPNVSSHRYAEAPGDRREDGGGALGSSHTMSLEIGSRLGHYDVTALIGEAGMGQVSRGAGHEA